MKALIILSGLGVISLLAEILNFKKRLFPIVLIGLVLAIIMNTLDWGTAVYHYKMMYFDDFAVAFSEIILVIALLWFIMSANYFKEETNLTDHFALILFALAGAIVMVSYANMTMLFIGIEILSLSLYVLAGSRKSDPSSNEAAFKYFLMGSFATGFLLFGITLIYGTTGSFDLREIWAFINVHPNDLPGMFYTGVILMLVGLSFKVSAVPFHFWAPDVYQGAPTVVSAFMATIVKTAAFAAFFRLFQTCFSSLDSVWATIIWVMAGLTLVLGNVTAVYQTSVKRMLAYSSVSHAGYMLLAILAMNSFSSGAILYYSAAYSVATIGAFAVLYLVIYNRGNDSLDSFNGLAKDNPFLAFGMTVAMLSLSGIPPLAGFFAKYYIFTAALQEHYIGLVVIAILSSLVGVYYYFRIIINMYFKTAENTNPIHLETSQKVLIVITVALALAMGLFPDFIIRLL